MSVTTAPVVGDGTTAASRARRRWRRLRAPLVVLVLLALAGLLAALPTPRTSADPLAPDNPDGGGARAAAQILGREGVDVEYVRRHGDAVRLAEEGTTLLVIGGDLVLEDAVLEELVATGADLVLVDAVRALSVATDAVTAAGAPFADDGVERTAQCDDPDAQAAGSITASGGLQALTDDAVVCFPGPGDAPGSGAYAVVDGPQRVTALADSAPLTNDHLATAGNAALVLRMLGRNDRLVWYIPSYDDVGAGSEASAGPGLGALLPPAVPLVALQLVLVVVAAAVWRGRRLGRVVAEPLPVVVPAAETTRGRGRLYRRSRSYGHAAAALRAGAASRCAQRLGLARSADAHTLVDAVVRATGRPTTEVEALLYGPPPHDDLGLARLAQALDHLESEVHRP
ncbi:DUF4350 domain-containing protein [Cellulomonas biazotea]|uniref:DUF4350 domain-containing protein n=1 Tax=Cellulomonas biazotea TaxID=1709 RepID=A0A402DWN6_9CELL|nr:DUF4350 domain-containing protein [Cellulomonas biazotea]GCE78515.1 hypothetical protein CBZ_35710 [Cellulomonas biazotea]